jgi:hypothetical protein
VAGKSSKICISGNPNSVIALSRINRGDPQPGIKVASLELKPTD